MDQPNLQTKQNLQDFDLSPKLEENPHKALKTICPIFVGVAGMIFVLPSSYNHSGSASGKTTLCNKIIQSLALQNCQIISFDSFYKT